MLKLANVFLIFLVTQEPIITMWPGVNFASVQLGRRRVPVVDVARVRLLVCMLGVGGAAKTQLSVNTGNSAFLWWR